MTSEIRIVRERKHFAYLYKKYHTMPKQTPPEQKQTPCERCGKPSITGTCMSCMKQHGFDHTFDLPEIIRHLAAEWGITPYQINSGDCEEFMVALCEAARLTDDHDFCTESFLEPEDHFTLPGHVWTYTDGRHYDAEAPDGVEDWRNLPIFQRIRKQLPEVYQPIFDKLEAQLDDKGWVKNPLTGEEVDARLQACHRSGFDARLNS